jgi:drug/metabolite transporter (DMT)-like permease
MHSLLTKRIELPSWLVRRFDKIDSILGASLGVIPLAAVSIVSAILCGVAYLLQHRVGVELGVWCEVAAALGPIWCLFIVGLLLAVFLRTGRRHWVVFWFGAVFGLAAFSGWSYAVIYH